VVSLGKPKVGVMDYLTLMPCMVYLCPKLITAVLPANGAAIAKKVEEITQTVNGGSNLDKKIKELALIAKKE
jgi:hypothetical protein